MASRPKRPRDPIQLAKLIGDISTGQVEDKDPNAGKNPDAVSMGRLGGLARAKKLTESERTKAAQKAVSARWKATQSKQASTPDKTASKLPKRRGVIRVPEE